MGTDLSAQTARAAFFADHGYTPIDLRWYGGVDQLGYSLVSPAVMATLGVRVTGVLSVVGAAALFAVLLRRTRAARPWPAALLGAAGLFGNLISGRVTYGLGVFFSLAALVALTGRWRWLAVPAALLAAATSPVAGLFVGLAGVVLVLSGRVGAGLLIGTPAAIPLALTSLLFGDGGWMNLGQTDAVRAVVTSLVVAALVPARPVRIGALLAALGVTAAALIHTPVGLNATRLVVMFALPVLAGYATLPKRSGWLRKASPIRPGWLLVALLMAVCVWQPPVVALDVADIGNPAADRAYFAPVLNRLRTQRLTGRVEVPPTRDYGEAAYLDELPLARGWLRQADIARNPLFFTTVPGAPGTGVALTADSYQAWLADKAVQFIAVPDTELSWPGRTEAAMITAGLPYLTQIWQDPHWRLYAVANPQPIVAAPATLVSQSPTTITVDVAAAATVVVRVHYYRWLRASAGAAVESAGDWTRLRLPGPGRYQLTSSLKGN